MANPSDKSPSINRLLSNIVGKDRENTIRTNQCMTCSEPAEEFKDALSRKEYTISGMCQRCQDSVFGIEEE